MRLLPRSLPHRVTLVVVLSFFVLSAAGAVVMLTTFRGHLEGQVRDDDVELLDRQLAIIDDLQMIVDNLSPELASEWATPEELTEVLRQALTIIPDDGTLISVVDAETGEVYTTSAVAFDALKSSFDVDTNRKDLESITTGLATLERAIEDLDTESAAPAVGALIKLRTTLLGDLVAMTDEQIDTMLEANSTFAGSLFGVAGGPSDLDGVPVIRTVRNTELEGIRLQVVAESSAAGVEDAVGPLRTLLWFVVPLLTLLVGAIAWLTTRRSLRPVESITRQVREVTTDDLSERVPVPDTRDEIEDLATTMNTMLTRLEEGQDNQRRFFADASHELRTPLATIAAELDVAAAIGDKNDWQRSAEVIGVEQRRLSALVDDLFFLARLRENPQGRRTEVDLDDIVREHVTRSWPVPVSAAQVHPVRMQGEPRQLDRLVQNAVANAARHAATRVTISLERRNGTATLTVEDDGAGIPVSDRERVFERFTRLEEARERDAGGAGLGLAMIREVAEAHGGTAAIDESALGGVLLTATFQAES